MYFRLDNDQFAKSKVEFISGKPDPDYYEFEGSIQIYMIYNNRVLKYKNITASTRLADTEATNQTFE